MCSEASECKISNHLPKLGDVMEIVWADKFWGLGSNSGGSRG